MTSIQIHLLGRLLVVTEKGPVRFPSQKAGSLLAFLVISEGPVTRERLAGVYWPDVSEERARRNLSTALWRMRTALRFVHEIRVVANGDTLCLGLSNVDVDVFRFRQLAEQCRHATRSRLRDVLTEAMALYRGDFLDGFQDEWCDSTRRELRELYTRVLKRQVEFCRDSGNFEEGIQHARKIVDLDPIDEDAQRELMSLYYLAGDRGAALAQYDAIRRILRSELGVEPTEATVEMWQHIRVAQPQHGSGPRLTAPRNGAIQSKGFIQAPMVGRDEQIALLVSSMDSAVKGHGRALVIAGEPGVGKTRLIEALTVEATLRGLEVLHGSCPDAHGPAPYQVFVQALWPRILVAQRESEGDASPLITLVNALASGGTAVGKPLRQTSTDGLLESSVVIETLLSLLLNDCDTHPTLIVLEDFHRAERASVNLLASLLSRLDRAKLLLVISVRDDEPRTREVISLIAANGALHLKLNPLSETDTEKLLHAVLRTKRIPPTLARFVWGRTNGIPLYVLEFLKLMMEERLLVRTPSNQWTLNADAFKAEVASVPSRMHELICRRIEALTSKCRSVLNAAAVLGLEVSFDHLRELVNIPENDFVDSTDQLVRAELLIETERGFRFPHESIRLVTLSALSKARRRQLHRQVGVLIEQTAPGRSEDLAWHFDEGGDDEKALEYSEASGDKASVVHANGDAVMWYSKALRLTRGGDGGSLHQLNRRARILLKRQSVLDLLGSRQDQARDIDEIQSVAEALGDRRLHAEAFLLRANLFTRLNAAKQGLEFARRAAHLFRDAHDLRGEARAEETAGLVYQSVRRYDAAEKSFRKALGLFRRQADLPGRASCLFNLGTTLSFRNKNIAALAHLDQADVTLGQLGDRRSRAHVFIQKGILHRYMGKLTTSEFYLHSGIEIMRRIGDRVGEARGLFQLGFTHAAMGKLRDALHESERALQMATGANDVRARIMILNNAACGVLRVLGVFVRAQRYVSKAIELVREAGQAENPATYADTMAAVLLDQGNISEALRWSRSSKTLYRAGGVKNYVGSEIRLRLGSIYLEMGHHRLALRELRVAHRDLARDGELGPQLQVSAALARLHLDRGDLPSAVKYAAELSRLLKKADGTEQIQGVYWSRFCVLEAAGQRAAARRALRQAYSAVMQQASSLKGPLKRRFLEVIKVNRLILEEAARRGIRRIGRDAAPASQPTATLDTTMPPSSRESGLTNGHDTLVITPNPALRRMSVEQRRRMLAELMSTRRMTQKEVAENLGVSVRTIRSDTAVLRRIGLLNGVTKAGTSQNVG